MSIPKTLAGQVAECLSVSKIWSPRISRGILGVHDPHTECALRMQRC